MPYRFALKRQDYSDYASGRVFYHLPSHPTFPIRLGMEVFERCMAIRTTGGASGPVRMYDPCCGEAYHLAVLAMFYWQSIAEIIGSDIDPEVLSVARRNLSLLTAEGLDRRIHEIGQLSSTYGKASHDQALVSAAALKQKLADNTLDHAITTHLFQADAGDQAAAKYRQLGPIGGRQRRRLRQQQCNEIGGVGSKRRQTREQQGWKGEEGRASRHGADDASAQPGGKQHQHLAGGHP